ncbi:hypothetical protein [Bacillus marasmi]|uniref:hypothetical protein n=1 Tax=Bacillus marasmi TaxID=1926279 RepID=UPI001FEA7468|nr:hypothetical protein [Bacillus marasmi]
MSVRKVKLSQLQQEGKEYLRKQRLLRESQQKKENQINEDEQQVSSIQEPLAEEQPQTTIQEQTIQNVQSSPLPPNQQQLVQNVQSSPPPPKQQQLVQNVQSSPPPPKQQQIVRNIQSKQAEIIQEHVVQSKPTAPEQESVAQSQPNQTKQQIPPVQQTTPASRTQSRVTGNKIQRKVTNQKEIFHNQQPQEPNPISIKKSEPAPPKQQLITNPQLITKQQLITNQSAPVTPNEPVVHEQPIPASEEELSNSTNQPVLASKTTIYENYILPVEEEISEEQLQVEEENSLLKKDLHELNEAGSVIYKIPVFFSHQDLKTIGPPDASPLSENQQFVIRMFKEIKNVILFPRTLPNTEQFPDARIDHIRTIVQESYGTVAVLVEPTETTFGEPYNPYSQFEPAMAYNNNHPLLLVIQDSMSQKAGGVWGSTRTVVPFSPLVWHSKSMSVDEFFESLKWKEALFNWASQVRNHYFTQTGQKR